MATLQGSDAKPRRKKGTGSIFPTKEGTFRATIKLQELNGDITPHTRRFATEDEAETYLSELVARHKGGALTHTAKQESSTVQDLMRNWVNHKYQEAETSGKPTVETVYDYEAQVKMWILPTLGTIELTRLHKDNIYEWLTYLHDAKSEKTGKALSNARKHRIWGVLKQAMTYGVREDFLLRNPLLGITGITAVDVDVREKVMQEDDYQKFMAFIEGKGCQHKLGYCELRWLLAIKGTRRQMEVLGLDWSYVHLTDEPPYIQIQARLKPKKWLHNCGDGKQDASGVVVYPCGHKMAKQCSSPIVGGLQVVGGTKGGQSNKPIIPIDEFLDAFLTHKVKQQEEVSKSKSAGTYSPLSVDHMNLVFTQPATQRAYQPRMDAGTFERIIKEAGITRHYTVHDLRHTGVSRIVEATGNIRLAQQIAGHKTLAVTGKYAKPSLDAMQDGFTELRKMDKRKKKALNAKPKPKAVEW